MDELARSGSKQSPAVSPADAAALARMMHAEMDEVCDRRAEAVESAGRTVACEMGCNACCAELVMVYRHETLAVVEYLERPENAAARQQFLDRYADWRAAVGDVPERLAVLDMVGRAESFSRAHAQVWKDAVMCAFDDDGRCTVYEVRPNLCRGAHALDTAAHCSAETEDAPEYFDFVPVKRLGADHRPVKHAIQRGLGLDYGMAPLCDEVYRVLVPEAGDVARDPSTPIGRNEPCPCGSGKKYKRCCGA
jgi:Fe-S-cluster containining protein